nr:glycoside hydrolase family 2 TIM barrel-domain containing protein [Domibacillus robiginosus]
MITETKPNLGWLSDPAVFAVNRLPAHSDHLYYETMEEAMGLASMPLRYDLNGSWKFHYAANPSIRPEYFYRTDFNCLSWGDITVPGHIQLQGYGKPQYVNTMYPWDGMHDIRPPHIPADDNPVGSYVKYFEVPENMENKPLYISFEGVESAFYIWLNGEFVGYSEDSFTPAEFELTPFLKKGENKLAVEVYQRSTGSWLEDQDFWRFSGIFRDVYLYTVPDLHVRDLHIQVDLDASYTDGTIKADLFFLKVPAAGSAAAVELYNATGQLISSQMTGILEKETSLSLAVRNSEKWSAESPYLYTMYFRILDENSDLVEVIPQKVGFRKFEMIDNIMCLNGERIVFKGINRHEFNCRTGRAITKEDMLWDIKTLKQNNINAVRTSHYPNQSEWYDLCDKYGIYVIDEMNLETHGSWQKMGAVEPSWNIPGNQLEWQDIVMDRAISMFERDKNHPSILIWSCGNESYAGEVILSVSKYFKSVDPERLVHYEGVFHNRDYNDTSDMESRMYAKPADIEAYLSDKPDKPYISCEYMHAMGNSLGGMHKYTELEDEYPMYQGGFIWDYIDQSLIRKDRYGKEFLAYGGDFGDRPTDYSFCGNGIVTADRKLSPKMQEVKFLYQNIKLLPEKNEVKIQNQQLFLDTSGLELQYVLYHEGIKVFANKADIHIEAQSTQSVSFQWPEGLMNRPGEYCIHVQVFLKKGTIWADKGHEVAFGQHVFKQDNQEAQQKDFGLKALRVVNGDVNIGIHGLDFTAIFSKQAGSLVSLKYEGKEMIEVPPAPLFWRAQTDNDKGYSQAFHSGGWLVASIARKCSHIELKEEGELVSIVFTYTLPISMSVEVSVRYTVDPDGNIHVKTAYRGARGLPNMPIFALYFKVSADYDQFSMYAMGPDENYCDRSKGARLGWIHGTVSAHKEYLVPQQSGNHTGVRKAALTNKSGKGIQISSVTEPLECQFSPYTAFEIENASHHYELPEVHYTVVTVAERQMGVGGDDSWGAPVHEEYVLCAEENREFELILSRI